MQSSLSHEIFPNSFPSLKLLNNKYRHQSSRLFSFRCRFVAKRISNPNLFRVAMATVADINILMDVSGPAIFFCTSSLEFPIILNYHACSTLYSHTVCHRGSFCFFSFSLPSSTLFFCLSVCLRLSLTSSLSSNVTYVLS